MLLEKIIRQTTLADGYKSNDRLKRTLNRYVVFYAIQIVLLLGFMAIHYRRATIDFPPHYGFSYELPVTISVILIAFYATLAGLLGIASKYDIPWLSAIVSMVSLIFHLAVAVAFGALAIVSIYGVASSLDKVGGIVFTELSTFFSKDSEFIGGVTTFLWVTGVVIFAELLVWIFLLFTTVSRSMSSSIAALKKVPGLYEYAHGTHVFSSTKMELEMEFLSDMLSRSRGYAKSDVEEILKDEEKYLIRLVSRNGDLVAASLQELPDYSLIALFGGDGSKSLNVEILLEDSFNIQKIKATEACASLRKDELILGIAAKSGWTVDTQDSLMSLRKQ